ncbi:MAG: hypothetical protein LBC83_02235 [Oscillospiraceae bacterium]|nr:hypothetical protein [Oscillospiraceae bacterium]
MLLSGVGVTNPMVLRPGIKLRFDLNNAGDVIGNKFSDANAWQLQGGWAVRQPCGLTEREARFPYLERVQLMTATGGNMWRDLFVDPLDRSTMTDYAFEPLISACRNIVALGLTPEIKTGSVPLKFCAEPNIQSEFDVNSLPPDDFDVYYDYIKAIGDALVAEFGIQEVKTWRFGVFTEYENKEWFAVYDDNGKVDANATKIAYFKLYDYTVAALEAALGAQNLDIGAHAMQCTNGLWSPRDFILHCGKGTNYATGGTGTQIDYLASSYYDPSPGNFNKKSLADTILELKRWADEAGLSGLSFGFDEGRLLNGADGRPLYLGRIVAMSYQAAADARQFKTMIENDIDFFSSWDGGLNLSNNGVDPVSKHVANLGYKMAGDRFVAPKKSGVPLLWCLNQDINGVGGYDAETNTARIMAYHFNANPNAKRVEPLTITIEGLDKIGKKVKVRQYIIDDNHANFWPLWWADQTAAGFKNEDYGASSQWDVNPAAYSTNPLHGELFNKNLERYRAAAKLQYTEKLYPVQNGKLVLTPTMEHHAVVFYEILKAD